MTVSFSDQAILEAVRGSRKTGSGPEAEEGRFRRSPSAPLSRSRPDPISRLPATLSRTQHRRRPEEVSPGFFFGGGSLVKDVRLFRVKDTYRKVNVNISLYF